MKRGYKRKLRFGKINNSHNNHIPHKPKEINCPDKFFMKESFML